MKPNWRWGATDTWRRLRLGRPRLDVVAFYETRVDVPDELDRNVVAIVGAPERPKWAVFECPCGRGHQLLVDLQHSHKRHWQIALGSRGPTVHPSIDSRTTFRCHFWLGEGRVWWVRRHRR